MTGPGGGIRDMGLIVDGGDMRCSIGEGDGWGGSIRWFQQAAFRSL